MAHDPIGGGPRQFPPCGFLAGIYARTDARRGVWKAPAGIEAGVIDALEPATNLSDCANGQLNQVAINCLRKFPIPGTVVWGARTMQGADGQISDWKYVPVRRLALFIEESLFRGTHWVTFEPNDEALWAQIRLNVGAFLQSLFQQGASRGNKVAEAWFVKCDSTTTTPADVQTGIINFVVGFAPLKPAEFVVVRIQKIVGANS